jgi:hypothetical protein
VLRTSSNLNTHPIGWRLNLTEYSLKPFKEWTPCIPPPPHTHSYHIHTANWLLVLHMCTELNKQCQAELKHPIFHCIQFWSSEPLGVTTVTLFFPMLHISDAVLLCHHHVCNYWCTKNLPHITLANIISETCKLLVLFCIFFSCWIQQCT